MNMQIDQRRSSLPVGGPSSTVATPVGLQNNILQQQQQNQPLPVPAATLYSPQSSLNSTSATAHHQMMHHQQQMQHHQQPCSSAQLQQQQTIMPPPSVSHISSQADGTANMVHSFLCHRQVY